VSTTSLKIPLLPQQRAMLVGELLLGAGIYNIGWRLSLPRANFTVLAKCLDELIASHPLLRMTLEDPEDGELDQGIIFPGNSVRVAVCRSLTDVSALTQAVVRPHYAFGTAPLTRFALGVLNDNIYVCVGAHHALMDQWSSRLLFEELLDRYEASLEDRPYSSLLADFPATDQLAGWQEEATEDPDYADQFQGHVDPLTIGSCFPRPAFPWASVAIKSRMLDTDGRKQLGEAAKRLGVTPYFLGFAAFSLVLARRGDRTKIVVGFPFHGRMTRQDQTVLSAAAALILVPVNIATQQSVGQFVRSVQDGGWRGIAQGPGGFSRVLRAHAGSPSFDRHPLVQYCFVQIVRTPDARTNGTAGDIDDFVGSSSPFDLKIYLDEQHTGIVLHAEYPPDLFPEATAGELLEEVAATLDRFARSPPDDPLGDLMAAHPVAAALRSAMSRL
jgi:Condensation domain